MESNSFLARKSQRVARPDFGRAPGHSIGQETATLTDMARSRLKATGRSDGARFVAMPHAILKSSNYAELRAPAVKLMLDLYVQYNGYNNGDFAMAWSMMRKLGWRSKDTLYRARDELLGYGFITQTRQGGKHKCSLYAVTWQPIDNCRGKLDCPPTSKALGYWKKGAALKLESVPRIRTTVAR